MNSPTQKKPAALIREFHLADWFTLGNAVCGTAALFSTITYVQTGRLAHIYCACALGFAMRRRCWQVLAAFHNITKVIPTGASHD